MSVTITLPRLELPDEYPLLAVDGRPWERDELHRLAAQLVEGAALEDRGLWHVAATDTRVLEVYAASRSFRITEAGAGNELDRAGEEGLDPAKAERLAIDFLADFRPDGADLHLSNVSESEVLVSERPDTEPRRLVLGTQVSFAFLLDGVALIGPGGKAQVTLDARGQVTGAYRMWRDVAQRGTIRGLTTEEIGARFGASPAFARLTDDTARVEVTTARAGLYSLPPTEVQDVLYPAIELRGTITTKDATVGFATHVSAVDLDTVGVSRRRQQPPSVLVA
jgi:hypothetical protein